MDNSIYLPDKIQNKSVLIAPLDWGMGHTTRCVSIIRNLLKQGNNVVFAGNDTQRYFMRKEFPEIRTEYLEGYNVLLDSTKNTYLQIAKQGRKVQAAILKERRWVNDYLQTNQVDVIISDNRYGFRNASVTSILLTHQLNLQLPSFRYLVNLIVNNKVSKFNAVWIPDDSQRTLTGELSNRILKIPVHYIGLLNRFEKTDAQNKYDYLVILSGPEPERTNFLEFAKKEMKKRNARAAFVGAEVDNYDSFQSPSTCELQTLIAQSNSVFSRAGYTTIMEMVGLNKKAILIPTKGQYEQEYLAKHVKVNGIHFQ